MKKSIIVLFLLACGTLQAQNVVKERYTVSGGLLGQLNISQLRVTENTATNYTSGTGWGAGAWLNIPVVKWLSIEPQAIYNNHTYQTNATFALLKDSRASFLSVPVQLKFHFGENFALTAGPQFDFLMNVKQRTASSDWVKDDVEGTSISALVGVEAFPHAKVTPFLRYQHGLTNLDAGQRPSLTGNYYQSSIQIGAKFKLFGKKIYGDSDGDGVVDKDDKCPTVVGLARYQGCPIPDRDGDGVNDEEDKCPDQKGLAKYQGCPIPDRDKDGVNDEEDKCPDVAGLAKYQGCPIPDRDKDGINDEQDKCPDVAGLARYQGCPIPDSDGDGLNDEEDKCPNVAGTVEMQGCPVMEKFNASAVTFTTGKSILTAGGKKELDKVVTYMTNNPGIAVQLDGYTDNSGSDKINTPLSQARAEAAKAYIVSKGIDASRISAAGYGSASPVADNKTAAGRAKNRRVEAKARN